MRLWLLFPRKDLSLTDNPWSEWYDRAFGFVVRAETEEQARNLAEEHAGDESWSRKVKAWIDAKYSICVELSTDGPAEMILRDYSAG